MIQDENVVMTANAEPSLLSAADVPGSKLVLSMMEAGVQGDVSLSLPSNLLQLWLQTDRAMFMHPADAAQGFQVRPSACTACTN